MNVRQLRKLVLETINEQRRPKRKQRRTQNRKKVMAETLRRARRQLSEISSASDYYKENLKGSQGNASDKGNIFKAMGIEDGDKNAALWKELYADNPTNSSVSEATPKCSELLPTQSQIGSANSLGNIFFGGGYSGDGFDISKDAKSIIEGGAAKFATPILIASAGGQKYIIDGHHRWSQIMMLGSDLTINAIELSFSGNITADDILQAVHVAISENTGTPESPFSMGKKFNGENILDAATDAEALIKEYTEQLLADGNPAKDYKLGGSVPDEFRKWARGAAKMENAAGRSEKFEIPNYKPESNPGAGRPNIGSSNVDSVNEGFLSEAIELTNVDAYDRTSSGMANAEELMKDGGSSLPFVVGGAHCTLSQYMLHFIKAIQAMQSQGHAPNAPTRIMMPQADDMKDAGTDGMKAGGKEVFDHIANNQITIPGAAGTGAGGEGEQEVDEDGDEIKDSYYRRGNVVTEHKRQLNRWNKLAGLLKD